MSSSNKKSVAKKLLSKEEKAKGTTPFNAKGWDLQKKAIAQRVETQQGKAHARAVIRKENAKPKSQTKKELKEAKKIVKKIEAKKSRHLKYLTKKNK